MSKIIKKGDLDLVIESTLNEIKLTSGGITEVEVDSNLDVTEVKSYNTSKSNTSSRTKVESEEVIGTGDTGESDEDGAPESEKGEKEFDKDEDKTNISEKEDVVEVSVNELAESVVKTTSNDILKEDIKNFNKLINYRK